MIFWTGVVELLETAVVSQGHLCKMRCNVRVLLLQRAQLVVNALEAMGLHEASNAASRARLRLR